ncbi:MAG TPA: sugar phosphate isomerase/epimerase [Gemmatimonadales bacterium]|jgi:sugar phosphate isomerase/epimerase|nr:sugar phosphate isomerase/epimerase [Gemmatimonadales bacterium]
MSSRRGFLQAAGAAALAPLLPALPTRLNRIGIELYTVRREFASDPERTLARVAEIGFREVEFSGYPPGTPQAIRQMLQRHGLRAPASHVPLQSLQTDWNRTLDFAALAGQRYVVVAYVPAEQRRSADDWKRLAAAFNRAAGTARRHGMRFCYHNHDFEFPLLNGVVPYDLLLAETDPRLVGLELDLYWITKAGRDPLEYFAKWPGRFPLVHVKDMDATPRKFFADVGKGSIDFRRIFRQARLAGIQHYFYEQDETPGDPFISAKASYDYLRSLTF